jgi:oligoendopeptidase F
VSAVATGAEAVEWNLSDLYEGPDDPRIDSELDEALAASQAFSERYRGKLGELSASELNDAVAEVERINSASTRVETYARLR